MKKLLLTTTILATSILAAGCGAKEETIVETTNTDAVVSDVVETEEIIVDEVATEEMLTEGIETETEEEEAADYIREISIDGVKVKMPCAVEEFEALGFTPNAEEVRIQSSGHYGIETFYKTPSGADVGVRGEDGYIYKVLVKDCELMGIGTEYTKPDKIEDFEFELTTVGMESADDYDFDSWRSDGSKYSESLDLYYTENFCIYHKDGKVLSVYYGINTD